MRASEILKVAAEVRAMLAQGRPVCNLTVGDFDSRQFPIPRLLLEGTKAALDAGETNYPPGEGIPALREAIRRYTEREQGVSYPLESVLVTSGSRPVLYAAYRTLVGPGDRVLFGIPSWNNEPYSWLAGGTPVAVPTRREAGFQPTFEDFAPHLPEAKLLCLCTPANPTGTVLPAETLTRIMEAVVEENGRRVSAGHPCLFVLHDQVYGSIVFDGHRHAHPAAVVPESAPYLISLDGISKAYSATGLRVGWCVAPPLIAARMRDMLAHVGAWAPRAEQVATAAFLDQPDAVRAFRRECNAKVEARLSALAEGVARLKAEGLPIDCIPPQGSIYLSLRLDLIGRRLDGEVITTNETIRHLLLARAGWAVVPFQAFGLPEDTGWFRVSVGAVSVADIEAAMPRIRAMLEQVETTA